MQTESTSSASAIQWRGFGLGAAVSTAGHTLSESMQVKETEPRHFCALEKSGIEVAALEHCKLVRGHLPAVGPELAVQAFADGTQLFIGGEHLKRGGDFVLHG